jgi:RNA polymerase sigma factor (sigma-70 family)
MVALTRAATRWESGQGATFATYAATAIHRQIVRALSTLEDAIKIPRDVRHLGKRVRDLEQQYAAQQLEPPSDEEIAAILEIDDVAKIGEARDAAYVSGSLNRMVGEDGETELIALQADPTAHTFAEELAEYTPLEIRQALARLKPRDREIIVMRHVEGKDLKEIGSALGVSAERVRAQERRAEGKYRRALKTVQEAKIPAPQASQSSGRMSL